MKIRSAVDEYITSWQRVENGIVTGCTISPILFVMGMGMVTRAAERETREPRMDSGIYQPPIRGFMDDLTVTTTTHIQARWVYQHWRTFYQGAKWHCFRVDIDGDTTKSCAN